MNLEETLVSVWFEFGGEAWRGIEQNPETRSRWAQLAAAGAKVMQFTVGGRYRANVVDGKITNYDKSIGARQASLPGDDSLPGENPIS